MSDFCTFEEVLKELQVEPEALNKWLESGELRPIVHGGGLKFRGSDVEKIKKQLVSSQQRYSRNQVLNILQLESSELQDLIDEGEFSVFEKNGEVFFDKAEVDQYLALRQVDATIVLDEDSPALVDEQPKKQKQDDFDLSLNTSDDIFANGMTIEPEPLAMDSKAEKNTYSLDETLATLQIEEAELDAMIADGEISVTHNDKGKAEFSKAEVDAIRNERMVDATMVIKKHSGEENKANLILPTDMLSDTNMLNNMPVGIQPEDKDELYSFDEALYQLQLTPSELKKMITSKKINAIPGRDGSMKFRKSEILKHTNKVEPTVILSDEKNYYPEDTISLSSKADSRSTEKFSRSNVQIDISQLKQSFYALREVAEMVRTPLEQLQNIIVQLKIRTYLFHGENSVQKVDLPKICNYINEHAEITQNSAKQASQDYYSWDETTQLLSIDSFQLQVLVGRGELQAKKIGQIYFFPKAQVDARRAKAMSSVPNVPKTNIAVPPITRPGSAVPPITRPGSAVPPIARPGSAVPPITRPGSAVPPITRPGSAVPPIARPGSAVPPIARPGSTVPPIARPGSTVPPLQRNISITDTYSLQETMAILSMSQTDIQRLIQQRKLNFLPNARFYKQEVNALRQNNVRSVVPNSLPSVKPAVKQSVMPDYQPATPLIKELSTLPPNTYFSILQACNELQAEESEINHMVKDGTLTAYRYQGQKYFKQSDVIEIQRSKMIEPTIMVGGEDDDLEVF